MWSLHGHYEDFMETPWGCNVFLLLMKSMKTPKCLTLTHGSSGSPCELQKDCKRTQCEFTTEMVNFSPCQFPIKSTSHGLLHMEAPEKIRTPQGLHKKGVIIPYCLNSWSAVHCIIPTGHVVALLHCCHHLERRPPPPSPSIPLLLIVCPCGPSPSLFLFWSFIVFALCVQHAGSSPQVQR
jgi:hypothetical protein